MGGKDGAGAANEVDGAYAPCEGANAGEGGTDAADTGAYRAD